MNDNVKNTIFAVTAIAIVLPSIFLIHNYVFYTSHFEKIEYEKIIEYCDDVCSEEFESKEYDCELNSTAGHVCVRTIDIETIKQQKEVWDNLVPPYYGYMEAVYENGYNKIGFLQEIRVIDDNTIEAVFATSEKTPLMKANISPNLEYHTTKILTIGDTFIPRCYDENIFVYKLHDIQIVDDVALAVFLYRIGTSDITQCVFPEFLEQSFGAQFDI
ncbi:MAG: hypothetical protein ACW9W3_05750 [Candidatus Nitrosopumilus sp. bin_68KS]